MKKTICFYFQIHLPYQLKRYRFFDIGNSHQYYDDFNIRIHLQKMAEQCYLPMNKLLLDIIKEYGDQFKVAFSITGNAIEQLEKYAPRVLDSFKELAATGSVEFICETYGHSLAFLKDEQELERQLKKQVATIKKYFNQKPTTVRLTGLIYSDQIGEKVAKLGFKVMLTEGAKHALGWRSPNFVYHNENNANLKVLLRNPELSNDIAYKFSDQSLDKWPITCEKFSNWLDNLSEDEEVINLFMDYITFGYRHTRSSGIFDFMYYLPKELLRDGKYEFGTPSETVKKHKSVGSIHLPYPISWSEEERDLSIWLGNDLQNDAFNALCDLGEKIRFLDDEDILKDWECLQDSDHYYYMCTKWMSNESSRRFKSVYSSPYDAYINYMNVLTDLTYRVNDAVNLKVEQLKKDKRYAADLFNILPIEGSEYKASQIKKIAKLIS